MDGNTVSNPTVASRMDQLDSSKASPKLRAVAGVARASKNESLANAKIQPRFNELLECFSEITERSEKVGLRFSDCLEIDSECRNESRSNEAMRQSEEADLEEKFTQFVGQTLFGSMLASLRKTLGKPAYMHGGRTEEVFQKQLDQVIVEDLTEASADSIASPMFDLFKMQKGS